MGNRLPLWVLLGAACLGVLMSALTQRGDDARERAETLADSAAALGAELDSVRAAGALRDAFLRQIEVEQAAERARLAREADRAQQEEAVARVDAASLREQLRATLDSTQLAIDDARQEAADRARRAMERRIELAEAKAHSFAVELREARLWGQAGWDLAEVTERALRIEKQRADLWERAANPPLIERLVGALPEVGTGALIVVAACLALCP